jgi:hypothetical protein
LELVDHLASSAPRPTILEELMKQARWAQLIEWSYEPALHTRLHFGRHRGERYDAVPVDYLECILASDLNASVKHSAQHWLKQRPKRGRVGLEEAE